MANIGEITIPVHLELSEKTKELIRAEVQRVLIDCLSNLGKSDEQEVVSLPCQCASCTLANAINPGMVK